MVCRFCALSMRSFVRLPLFSLFDLFQLQLSVKRMAKAQSECVYVVMVVVVCCELLPFCRVALCIMQLNRKMFFSFARLFASSLPLPMYLPFDKRIRAFWLKLNLVCLAVAFYGFVSTAFESKSSTFTRFTNLKSKIGSDSASLFLPSSLIHFILFHFISLSN